MSAPPRPHQAAPALPRGERAVHSPLGVGAVRLTANGPLGAWQRRNAEATIPHCIERLEAVGTLDNFRRLLGESDASFQGFYFADSDLYKAVEAAAWEIARSGTDAFDAWLDEVVDLIGRVQEPTGYVNTWVQGVHPEKKFAELEWTHELYCLGHMVQAAVALDRAAGRDDLLQIAIRFVDLVDGRFGPGREEGICGHPEIETALVELYRHTGERRYLRFAQRMIDLRGNGLLPAGSFGARYFQDHAPVREATSAVGHAVRQLYLNAGATDVYLETGDPTLLEAMRAQWSSAHERKMYLSGAFGSRHRDEAFGDDFELPSDRAYAETCATIADLQWSWRMLLAEGGARHAEIMEREIHNALAASVDTTGTRFFYSNPLQLRPDRQSEENAPRERASWYACACCPPNIARTVAQLSAYVASSTDDTLWLHQYADADIDLPEHLGDAVLEVRTAYPADGAVTLRLRGTARPGARLALRVPSWSRGGAGITPDGGAGDRTDGYLRVDLTGGDAWGLDLDMSPRWTAAHPRVDALRGCLALERGPVVYCVEQADLPDGIGVDDLILDPAGPVRETAAGLQVACRVAVPVSGLYGPPQETPPSAPLTVTAIPFASWGNREPGAMRVWVPTC